VWAEITADHTETLLQHQLKVLLTITDNTKVVRLFPYMPEAHTCKARKAQKYNTKTRAVYTP